MFFNFNAKVFKWRIENQETEPKVLKWRIGIGKMKIEEYQ